MGKSTLPPASCPLSRAQTAQTPKTRLAPEVGAWDGQGAHKTNQTGGCRGRSAPVHSPHPSLLTLSSPDGTLAAWTPGEAAARDPSTTPHPIYPGNCSNFFSKALNTEILSAAVGLPHAPALPRAVQPPGISIAHQWQIQSSLKKKNKTETHQINKSKRECARTQASDGETRGMK